MMNYVRLLTFNLPPTPRDRGNQRLVENKRWLRDSNHSPTVPNNAPLAPPLVNDNLSNEPVAMDDHPRRMQRARELVRDLRECSPDHCEVLSFCCDFEIKNARDSEDVATGIEDARNCCNVVIDWLRSGHGLRKLGWTGTLRMVMGAIKLCMRLTAMPRQTDSFAKPLDSRMCLKVAENGEFQQLLWALQSAIKDYLAPRVMAESDFVPSIVDDVFVLKHAASFFSRTGDMMQMKRHVRAAIDMTTRLLVRFSQDDSEGGYLMSQHFQVRKLVELRKGVEVMIDRLLKSTPSSTSEDGGENDGVAWKAELQDRRELFWNARGPGEHAKSEAAGWSGKE